jgi:type I restriction enzyme S subunit
MACGDGNPGSMSSVNTSRTPLPGWQERTLGEICSVITDGTHYTPTYVDHGVPFYSVESVTGDDFANVKYISAEEHRRLARRCRPKRGDILMTRIGSLAETKFLDWDVDASIYVSLALLRPGRGVDGRYLYAFTKSRRFVKAVEDRSLIWAAPKKINMRDIGLVPVSLPIDANEQRAIADVLFALEHQLRTLERFVAKKQAIKQGLMQQLLSGRTRLPGFKSTWSVRLIGDFAHVFAGGTPSTVVDAYWGGDIPWMSSGEIHRKELRAAEGRITALGLERSSAQLFPKGTVLMALAGQGKTRGTVAVSRIELATNQSVAGIFPSIEHDSDFLYYNLDSRYAELRGESAGDGGRGGLNLTIIKGLRVLLPSVEEQSAIARVLLDADRELGVLRRRLAKARDIKTGIMQELLTGRTRLPLDERAA